jgi:hypothetical protein
MKIISFIFALLIISGCTNNPNSKNNTNLRDGDSSQKLESAQNLFPQKCNPQYRIDIYDKDPYRNNKMFSNDTTCLLIDSIQNALIFVDECGWVRLTNGEYSLFIKDSLDIRIHFIGYFFFVDINGDGYKDVIACLSENDGGSGCFTSMDVFLNQHGSPHYISGPYIGDREGFDSLKVEDNDINVSFTIHGPNDPMCCPSEIEERSFTFANDSLIEQK